MDTILYGRDDLTVLKNGQIKGGTRCLPEARTSQPVNYEKLAEQASKAKSQRKTRCTEDKESR